MSGSAPGDCLVSQFRTLKDTVVFNCLQHNDSGTRVIKDVNDTERSPNTSARRNSFNETARASHTTTHRNNEKNFASRPGGSCPFGHHMATDLTFPSMLWVMISHRYVQNITWTSAVMKKM